MTVLNEFAADEQLLLMEGPRLGAVVVSAASLGQKRETASEGFAAADYILNSRGDYLDNAGKLHPVRDRETRCQRSQIC